jgi:hypothetical protein
MQSIALDKSPSLMNHTKSLSLTAMLVLALFSAIEAQPKMQAPDPEPPMLKVFLDCNSCDMNYLREQIPYINYVRDPEQSDVHVLVTSTTTGSNARTHVFDFLGKGGFEKENHTLEFTESPNASREERRKGIAKKLELGLIPYWIETGLASQMDVSVSSDRREQQSKAVSDPWNHWVFEVAGGGAFNKESARSAFNIWGSLRANRVTEEWRLRNRAYLRYEERVFKDEEGDIVSKQQRKFISSDAVKSLSDHWSTGLFTNLRQSTYENLDLGVSFAPALEFSIFPYSDVNRREVTIAYKVGYLFRNYQELTIFQKLQEDLWNHSLEFSARLRQPWGSLFAGIEGSQFFDDISKHRLQIDGYLNLRVLSGLSLQLGGDMALINDQRSIPAGETSLEDLLLAQRQLATNYRFSGSIGLKYTFGSMFNDVVNTRL